MRLMHIKENVASERECLLARISLLAVTAPDIRNWNFLYKKFTLGSYEKLLSKF